MFFRLTSSLLACISAAQALALASRQVPFCGSQPIDCGEGWCCRWGNICSTNPSGVVLCIDQLLTNLDGSPRAITAYNPASTSAILDGILSSLPVTTDTRLLTVTARSMSLTESVSETKSTASTSSTDTTTTFEAALIPTASASSSTALPSSTASSLGVTRPCEAMWMVGLGVAILIFLVST